MKEQTSDRDYKRSVTSQAADTGNTSIPVLPVTRPGDGPLARLCPQVPSFSVWISVPSEEMNSAACPALKSYSSVTLNPKQVLGLKTYAKGYQP